MKRVLSCIVIITLAVSLTACRGNIKPTTAPTSSTSSQPNADDTKKVESNNMILPVTPSRLVQDEAANVKAPTGKINADLQKRVLNGEIVKLKDGDCLDLNDDGVGEVIGLDRIIPEDSYHHTVTLTIGNRKITKEMEHSSGEFFAGTLYGNLSRFIQILVYEDGPSGDPFSNVFHYEKNRIWDCEGAPCHPKIMKITANGFTGSVRGSLLQYWYRPTNYVLCNTFVINDMQQKEFIPPQVKEVPREIYPMGTILVLQQDLILQDSKEPKSPTHIVKKGTKVCIVATDDVEWVLISPYESYYSGWMKMKRDSHTTCYNGEKEMNADELFDGLYIAD